MIPLDEALASVLGAARTLGVERVPLEQAVGRVLAESIPSDLDMPSFDVSAMDGFACRTADRGKELRVVETIAAGQWPLVRIGEGECSRIMTGAALPQGADRVIMFEDTDYHDGIMRVRTWSEKRNVRRQGEDARRGDMVLSAGTAVNPPAIALLASVGCVSVPVFRRPRVAVVATGSELVEPGQTPGLGQLRDSNSFQAYAQMVSLGIPAVRLGIARDTPEDTERMIRSALSRADVVLMSGGVSAGDFDIVPEVLSACGAEWIFRAVAVKPGKPTHFGTVGEKYVFGLPGNPASAFVTGELLVRPFINALQGRFGGSPGIHARLRDAIRRKEGGRTEVVPVKLFGDGTAGRLEYHGAAHIRAFVEADGMLVIPPGVSLLEKGTQIEVIRINGQGK